MHYEILHHKKNPRIAVRVFSLRLVRLLINLTIRNRIEL